MLDTPEMKTPFGNFALQRFPSSSNHSGRQEPLRAWDAADEYLLQWVDEHTNEMTARPKTLILNDSFGALGVALGHLPRHWQSDSFMAHQGCEQNLALNNSQESDATAAIDILDSLSWPTEAVDLVLIKVPKTSALLEHQLYHLRDLIHPQTQIIAAGMVKHIHTNTLKTFEKVLGTTTTSLAKKKARLIFCQADRDRWTDQSPYPSRYRLKESDLPDTQRRALDFVIHNHANVFSRASLDIGTRLFLQHLPTDKGAEDIIDLGCGNGLLGIAAAQSHPQARVHFVDESFMAIDSAKLNASLALSSLDQCEFIAGNSLSSFASDSADLVLNNPPFHQQSVVGDHIAWQMFVDSKRALRTGGSLWVIGNRHLNYHTKLKRLFGNCKTVASDRKFVVLQAQKR
ncbi:MAG: methyltransferase [Cellvibrionaceae bacterium]